MILAKVKFNIYIVVYIIEVISLISMLIKLNYWDFMFTKISINQGLITYFKVYYYYGH